MAESDHVRTQRAGGSESSPPALAELMSLAATEMQTSLARIRKSLSHNLSKGEALEESVRRFLRAHLPPSIGVASGQIIDSTGAHSPQLDVILFDAARTPMLFTSDEAGHQIIPSEGVFAVVEVKTTLQPSDVESVVSHMSKVKALDKSAYFRMPMTTTYNMYGALCDVLPTLYFVLSFESPNPGAVAAKLHELQEHLEINSRVDSCGSLDGSVIYNVVSNSQGDLIGFNCSPTPDSSLMAYPTANALLIWFLGVSSYVCRAEVDPIDLGRYLPGTFGL